MKKSFYSAALLAALHAPALLAGPMDYIYTPNMTAGETELDIKFGTARQGDGSRAQAVSVGLGYGVNAHWFTEGYFKRDQTGGVSLAEWENKFLLWASDSTKIGFVTELAAPLSNNAPWELRIGSLLQTELAQWQLNANLLAERAFGKADEHGVPFATNIGYQLQAKYRLQPHFAVGMQAMGEMGKWNQWDSTSQQNHRVGPAVFGKFKKHFKYNAAYLLNASNVAPKHTLRIQLEYAF